MKRILIIILALFFQIQAVIIPQGSTAPKQNRIALIIGNGNYSGNILPNPENDAKAMKDVLKKLGFEVYEYENLSQSQMKKAIDDFGTKMKNMEVALFFYAGHGIQANGVNFLVPVDAVLKSEKYVEYDCVQADRILAAMESSGSKVNIIILDACRDNPFERSWSRSTAGKGLAFMNAPSGTLIAYSTSPGSTASDGSGKNGLYTSALLESIQIPNITINQMFQNVRKIVMEKSDKKQVPWESTSLVGEFYFNPDKSKVTSEQMQPEQQIPVAPVISLPAISSLEITNISATETTLKTTIPGDGGAPVIARGVCYSLSPEPSLDGAKTVDGTGIGSFLSNIKGLTPNKTYHIRAYAINSAGTVYSTAITITTLPVKPSVSTIKISSVTPSTAYTGGIITNSGGAADVTARGVCWDSLPNPTTEKSKTGDSTGFGEYVSNLSGLVPNTTYYLRAYSTDQLGTYYGNELSFKTLKEGQFTDLDGNVYSSALIGTHTWMTENLRTTLFSDSTKIPFIADKQAWASRTAPGFCWYFNDEDTYKNSYGALYNWYAVSTGKLCPSGWHAATNREYTLLTQNLGGYWVNSSQTGVNVLASYDRNKIQNSGISARLGGSRSENGTYESIDKKGYYWIAEEYAKNDARIWQVFERSLMLENKGMDKRTGLSVRCVKD